MKYLICTCIILTLAGKSILADTITENGKRLTPTEYVTRYKDDAINDMMRTGVPASITLAQGILESESGNSQLARIANNHFGIKCHTDWQGATFHQDDDAKDECFRKYKSVLESFDDHSKFLRERSRYSFLFDLDVQDYKGWAHGLKKAGYATNPKYAYLLIKLIEEHELYRYDKGGRQVPLSQPVNYSTQARSEPKSGNTKHQRTTIPAKSAIPADYSLNAHDVPYIMAQEGDTYYSIAVKYDLLVRQLLKYNDAHSGDHLINGEIVYLKPKRGKPTEKTHQVMAGQTIRDIAQFYGISVRKLCKLNHLHPDDNLNAGATLRLR